MVVILSGPNALLSGCLIMLLIIVGEQYGCVLENVRVEFIWVILGSIGEYWLYAVLCISWKFRAKPSDLSSSV